MTTSTPKIKKTKANFFYARNGKLVRLKPQKHPLVYGFLKKRERQIIRWYSAHIVDEFMTPFPEYTLPVRDFERVKKELITSDEKIVIFLHDMFHPIARLQNETTLASHVPNQ